MLNISFICRFNERILVSLVVPSGSDLLEIITGIKIIQLYFSSFYLKLQWRWIQSCQPCTSKHLCLRYPYQASNNSSSSISTFPFPCLLFSISLILSPFLFPFCLTSFSSMTLLAPLLYLTLFT